MVTPTLHVAMFPWFAMGHLTPYLHLANKLANLGHKISFLVPTKTQSKLNHLNLHPSLITFIPLIVPHVQGLPHGAETMYDVPTKFSPLLAMALDLLKQEFETILRNLKPDFVFFDMACWIPKVARSTNSRIKTIFYCVISASIMAGKKSNEETEMKKPLWVEEKGKLITSTNSGDGISVFERIFTSVHDCDAICFRGCREIEGPYYDYLENLHKKKILLTGPVLYDPPNIPLEDRWEKWLGGFKERSVVYCAFGSECIMNKDQFQELVLGLELTGLPFLVALKVPNGAKTMQEALPEGFEERVQGRGVVHEGWVPQQLILKHPSLGCFVSHCGFGSMWESLVSDCQIVLIPNLPDQFVNCILLSTELKVGVQVERREEDGWFSKENVCNTVKLAMDEESELGRQVRANHAKWKDILLNESLESSYLSNLVMQISDMQSGDANQ